MHADLLPDKEALDWNTRMKIAAGTARGLEYLHDKANPPVIYQGFRSSNILLDEGFHPKLSDFGLVNLGSVGDKTHISTHVMGTYGYCAPEYATTGQLTSKSDVYSFGVVLLELITGRKAFDNTRAAGEHDLVPWVCELQPFMHWILCEVKVRHRSVVYLLSRWKWLQLLGHLCKHHLQNFRLHTDTIPVS